LPDASKNDVVFFNQRSTRPVDIGPAADLLYASRYARLTDFTVTDGVPSTLAASLVETKQTGSMRADVRGSQFAALASDVHPTARPSQRNMAFSVLVTPHTVDYPDMRNATSSTFYFQSLTNTELDFDYGTFAYPQFHDSLWKEYRQLVYYFDITLLTPGTKQPIEFSNAALVLSLVPMSPAPTDPIAPVLGPPTAPLLNGADAFVPQTGVGLQPVFSWLAPTLGNPTSYMVKISSLSPPREGETVGLFAIVYSGNSFSVPPGILQPGNSYYAVITAIQAPWDVLDRRSFRRGTPYHSTDCITGVFIP
jgi:hypothetical protein